MQRRRLLLVKTYIEQEMIPKIIHYCWFGGSSLPPEAQRCIASWKRFFPDYEIREWNETNFDVHSTAYTTEAYHAKKYAFVSDFARFKILYEYGGIYFDTDVEVIRSMDDIVSIGAFMGCEVSPTPQNQQIKVNAGLGLGVEAGHPIYANILETYQTMHFTSSKGKRIDNMTVVEIVTNILRSRNLKTTDAIQTLEGITIYPKEYFCPIDYNNKIHITSNTYTIHHFAQSWRSPLHKWARKIILHIGGEKLRNRISKIYQRTYCK